MCGLNTTLCNKIAVTPSGPPRPAWHHPCCRLKVFIELNFKIVKNKIVNIEKAQRYLGKVDQQTLYHAIMSLEPETWHEQLSRQQNYEVHKDTESILLLFCDEAWPDGEVHREAGWDHLATAAIPLIDYIIENYYTPGGIVIRAMAAKLKAGGRINPHIDALESFHMSHRIHVPITSNPAVRFMIEGKPYPFEVGKAYEINNQKKHSVLNMGKEDRISFIFDYVPPDAGKSKLATPL